MTDSFTLAVIGSPFGLKGHVKVKSLSGETAHLASLKSVMLRHKNTDNEKPINIEESAPCISQKGQDELSWILMKFEGIDSPEAAKNLTGAELIADRSLAAPLKQGEYYIEDLKGLNVVTSDAANAGVLGFINDIIEGGNGNLAEIRLVTGGIRLVPFRNEFFGDISLEHGSIILLETWILE